jgi:hypothetical protein
MEFSQLLDEALIFGSPVDVIVVVDFCSAPAQETLHYAPDAMGLAKANREIRCVDFGDQSVQRSDVCETCVWCKVSEQILRVVSKCPGIISN